MICNKIIIIFVTNMQLNSDKPIDFGYISTILLSIKSYAKIFKPA